MELKASKIINSLPQAIIILNDRGEIIYSTDYIRTILGYDINELVGKCSFGLLFLNNHKMIKLQYERIITTKNMAISAVLRMKHKEGKAIWTELTAKNLLHDKHIKGVLVTAKNIMPTESDRYITITESQQNEDTYITVVERFNELIKKNYIKQRSVQFYSDAMFMHPNHLNFMVKKFTGLTAKETISDYILTEAKLLLHSTSLTIKEMSYKLGFEDPNYFTSFFQKRMSLSPTEYRRAFV